MTTTQERTVSFSDRQAQARVEFGNPPVAETSLGFYFQRVDGWNVLHHGALWERFRNRYPEYEFLPTLMDSPPPPGFVGDVTSLPIRVAFVDSTKTRLVQVQNGLLLHNWRKTAHILEYQRYEEVKSQLRNDWHTLQTYLKEMSFKEPIVTRCQMDYFNHLVRGEEWQDFSDLPKIFTVWRGLEQSTVSGKLQMASFSVSYRLGDGTVNFLVQPAIRSYDGKEIVQFTLSSSVAPTSSTGEELFARLDECHVNAALALLDFTTDKARERWKEKK